MSLDVVNVDRRAWQWRAKLIECWRCHGWRQMTPSLTAALFLDHGMSGPLPHDRLELVRMATDQEDPSRPAFVTLALVDYVEDFHTLPLGDRTAKLPYQLAWARAGWTLNERTGLPGGIFKARWPEVDHDDIRTRPAPAPHRRVDAPGGGGDLEVPGRGGEDLPVPDEYEQLELLGADRDAHRSPGHCAIRAT